MPPKVAPVQVVVIPIPSANLTDAQRSELAAATGEIVRSLEAAKLDDAKLRVRCDDRDNYRPGWKYNHWEVKVSMAWGLAMLVSSMLNSSSLPKICSPYLRLIAPLTADKTLCLALLDSS